MTNNLTNSFLSRPVVFDFIKREGLQKLSGVTAHEWDLYILKELLDNALDADEADKNMEHPRIEAIVIYNRANNNQSFSIEVKNQSNFPIENTQEIFDFSYRASDKFFNYPSRGAQGNALKTILGMPYALNSFYFNNYDISHTPLIISHRHKYSTLKLKIDERQHKIKLIAESKYFQEDDVVEDLTSIKVNVRRFLQENPRTIDELEDLAQAFAMFNPHAYFTFQFIILNGDDNIHKTYSFEGNPKWDGKYDQRQIPPIHWYTLSQFRELIFSWYRQKSSSAEYSISNVFQLFGFAQHPQFTFSEDRQLSAIIDNNDELERLYIYIKSHQYIRKTIKLGEIGKEQIKETCKSEISQPHLFFYRRYKTSYLQEEHPFVLEVALFSKNVEKRSIKVGINHSQTYLDPFFAKKFKLPDSDEPVRGLGKVLDHYDLHNNTNTSLVIHLISPNLNYEDYGKSTFNDSIYRVKLVKLLHEVILEYKDATRPPTPVDHLTQPAKELLLTVIQKFEGSYISETQLLFQLKYALKELESDEIEKDLQTASADARLYTVIKSDDRLKSISRLQSQHRGQLALPQHPRNIISVPYSSILDVVNRFYIRAIVVTNTPEIEDILIHSRFPLKYDFGVLRSETNLPSAIDYLLLTYKTAIAGNSSIQLETLPAIWILRDASHEAIAQTRNEIARAMARYRVSMIDVVDFGLHPSHAQHYGWIESSVTDTHEVHIVLENASEESFYITDNSMIRLESLSPQKLIDWFEDQLDEREIPTKFRPDQRIIVAHALQLLQDNLKKNILSIVLESGKLESYEEQLIDLWLENNPDWKEELSHRIETGLTNHKTDSWMAVSEKVISELSRSFVSNNRSLIETIIN